MNEDDFDSEFDTYSFYYTPADGDSERELEGHIQLAWDAPWTQALEQYLAFLSSIYGYDLMEQVAVKFNANREPESWSGQTFGEVIMTAAAPRRGVQLELFSKGGYGGTD
jgi:hypothetical protein